MRVTTMAFLQDFCINTGVGVCVCVCDEWLGHYSLARRASMVGSPVLIP